MKYLVTLLVLTACAAPSFGGQDSGQLHGFVWDSQHLPIDGVAIELSDPAGVRAPVRTMSDGNGGFQFRVVPIGTYDLKATKTDFKEFAQKVTVDGRESRPLDLAMELAPFAETVVVGQARLPGSLLREPSSQSVLTNEEIKASAAQNYGDLLRRVPGLNIAQFSARDVEINARGSTGILSNSMLVLVDGRSFVQPFYGAIYWDLMTTSMDEIDRIVVVRTPSSAAWGANARSGVVNITTKSPRDMQGLYASVGAGERGTREAALTWADSTERFSYKLSASYFEQDPWDRDNLLPNGSPMPPTVVFENRGARQPKFDARIDWDRDPKKVWSLRGGITGAYGLTHSSLGPGEFAPGSYASYLQLDHSVSDTDFKVYWNRFYAPYRIVLFGLDENAVNDSYAAEVTHHQSAGNHQALAYGGSINLDRFDVTIAPAERRRVNAGAFVEDRIELGRTTNVVAGGRVDKFDTTKAVFAPRVGLTFSPDAQGKPTKQAIHIAYNRAYRAPSLLENFVDVNLPAVVPLNPPFYFVQQALGSTSLEMEKQDAVEVGYTLELNSRATIFATVYDQLITNKIWFLPVSFYGPSAPPPGWPLDPGFFPVLPHAYSFVNLGSVRDRGIELAANMKWGPRTSMQASYTFQADPQLDASSLPLQVNRPARHQFGGGLTYATARWSASGDAHYTDKAFWADVFTQDFWGFTDSYVNANGRVSYHPGHTWELWLSATNLLDEKIKSHVYGDIVRRKVTAGVRWELARHTVTTP
jgi:outer membrane receptor protein involved in Fe transport